MRLAVIMAFMAALAFAPATAYASAAEIDANVNSTLQKFRNEIRGGPELEAKAFGVLVFPKVVKAGFGFGGEIGNGALRQGGQTAGYYRTVTGSFGLQIGAQVKSVLIFFMTEQALKNFRETDGWQVGADASVVVLEEGLEASVDTDRVRSPIVAFVIGQQGLMAGVSLEGSKISRINP